METLQSWQLTTPGPFLETFLTPVVEPATEATLLERARAIYEFSVWPRGVRCARCGSERTRRSAAYARTGRYRCSDCRATFSVISETIFARTHVPIWKILQAFCILANGSARVSARRLHFMLRTSYQTAWELTPKVRECLCAVDRRFGRASDDESRVLRALRASLSTAKRPSCAWGDLGHLGLRWDPGLRITEPSFIHEDLTFSSLVNAACAGIKATFSVLVLSDHGVRHATYAGARGVDSHNEFRSPLPTGCLTKPIATQFVLHSLKSKSISVHADVHDIVKRYTGQRFPSLQGLKFHQLLTHTHGFDMSPFHPLTYTAAGAIDFGALVPQLVAARRVTASHFDPLFSYGPAGIWLATALCEHLTHSTFHEYVWRLFPNTRARCAPPYCPSSGSGLSLTLLELASFASLQLGEQAAQADEVNAVSFPGWSPVRRSARVGWFDHGGGWLGHNGQTDASTILVRFNPAKRLVVLVASDSAADSATVMPKLFRKVLPEFQHWPQITPLSEVESASLVPSLLAGQYANAHGTADIVAQGNTLVLKYRCFNETGSQVAVLTPLRISESNIIFTFSSEIGALGGLVQFIRPDRTGRPQYIWDGRKVWRRSA
jgi:transposase-like protein